MDRFVVKGVTDNGYAKRVGSDEAHLKCSFVIGNQSIDAIGLDKDDLEIVQSSTCDIAYVVDKNEW